MARQLDLTTPALLFPAISLLLLAYTNRFLTLAGLIRSLHASYRENPDQRLISQLRNLRLRIVLIRNMQVCGVVSFFLCVLAMSLIFWNLPLYGQLAFGASLLLLMLSLALSIWEIQISIGALKLQLSDLEG